MQSSAAMSFGRAAFVCWLCIEAAITIRGSWRGSHAPSRAFNTQSKMSIQYAVALQSCVCRLATPKGTGKVTWNECGRSKNLGGFRRFTFNFYYIYSFEGIARAWEVPPMTSTGTPASSRACRTPRCANPLEPPPLRTRPTALPAIHRASLAISCQRSQRFCQKQEV